MLLAASVAAPASWAQSTGVLRGRVLHASTGDPAVRVNVHVQGDGVQTGTVTDARGRYRIALPPGTYRVVWSGVSLRPAVREVTIAGGETQTLDLTLAVRSYDLNEIVVEGGRFGRSKTTTTLQTVEAAAIQRQDAADVSELAPLLPATHVQTNSRGQTILYFRNAGDRQVGQFFDGALLNIPWDNRVDISMIPAGVVEEVTVAKGVPSVRYGANVLGGAINFESRTLAEPGRTTELTSEVGTAGHRRAAVTHLGRTGSWDYTAAVQYAERGDLPLPQDADLEFNQPESERRVNTDRQIVNGFARAGYRFDGGAEVGVSLLHVEAEQGVAPEGNAVPDQTRYWRYPTWRKSVVMASAQVPVGSKTSLRGAAWGSRFAQDIDQYQDIAYEALAETQEDRDLTGGVRLIGTQDLSLGTLTLAVNGLTTRHHQTNIPFASGSAREDSVSIYRQHIYSTGLEVEAQIHPRVQIRAGASIDGTATPETGPFPDRDPFAAWGLTSGVRVDLSDRWSARAAAGRKSRFPTMRELFGAALGKFVPAPNLQPVTAWIGETGLEHRAQTWSVGATAFLNRVYDTIDKRTFQSGPNAGKEQRVNLDGARIVGVEVTARWQATPGLLVDGHVTWSRPRSFAGGDTQKLDEKPAWLATGSATYDLPLGLSLMGQARYIGGVYARNEQNVFEKLPESLVVDARVGYDLAALPDGWNGEVFARVDNLTDDAKFVGLGLPGPGRRVRAGVTLSF